MGIVVMRVVCDIETDSLDATKIWCIVAKDIDANQLYTWDGGGLERFREWALGVTEWWGHNFLCFDAPVLRRLLHVHIPRENIKDTLVLSRLFFPMLGGRKKILEEFKILPDIYKKGGHSLGDWGERLGIAKILFENFSEYSQEMLTYCKRDVYLCDKLREHLLAAGTKYSELSRNIEHEMTWILYGQKLNGFKFDVPKAQLVRAEIQDKANILKKAILKYFPIIPKPNKECTPVSTKAGHLAKNRLFGMEESELIPEGTFTKLKWQEFNLASSQQINERLKPYWKPYLKTPTGAWKVCEENLATIKDSAPEDVKSLHTWSILNKRLQALKTWIDAVGDDDRIHGQVDSSGTWTYRAVHYSPNTANIVGVKTRSDKIALYGKELRELWTVEEGNVLIGTDAASIQLRVLAHYINHPAYTKEVLEGDIHEKNREYMGGICPSRAQAKTYIYAWLLGAGVVKQADILGCTIFDGKTAEQRMINKTPGFRRFLERKRLYAKHGWMRGFDGRVDPLPSEHRTLAMMLQEGESTVMKLANILWNKWAVDDALWFKQLAFVHDEWQTESHPEDAETVGKLQVRGIQQAGKILKLNCPMDGKFKIGTTWAETH